MLPQMRFVLPTLLVSTLVAFLCPAPAQNLDNCSQASIVINVRDREGKFVDGLQPTSFRAVLRTQPIKILSGGVQTKPVRVVLLQDVSGSISWSTHDVEMVRSLTENLMAASVTPHVALVSFSDHIIDTLGFDRAPNEVLQKIAGLTNRPERTDLFGSLVYAIDLFHATQSGDAIYLISDGGDNHSKYQEKDVEHILLSKGIRLFCLRLSNRFMTTREAVGSFRERRQTECVAKELFRNVARLLRVRS
jgi:Ca-activated chloride channel family protein